MSTPRSTQISDLIDRSVTQTERGEFATFVARPPRPQPIGRVLLIPGFTGSKEDFGALLPLLAEAGWEAATYDQRGQYETKAAPDDDFSFTGLASDAVAVKRAIFGSTPIELVGHSFGGLVAGTAAIEHRPEWVSLLMLCSGPVAVGADREDLHVVADSAPTIGLEAIYQAGVERNRAQGIAPEPPDVEDFLHERFVENSPEALAAFARLLIEAPDMTPALAALDLPISVMRGADDDAWPHALQDEFAAAVGTRVVIIENAAHSPAVEQPEATRDAMIASWTGSHLAAL